MKRQRHRECVRLVIVVVGRQWRDGSKRGGAVQCSAVRGNKAEREEACLIMCRVGDVVQWENMGAGKAVGSL
jgi:hypothetical protein